MPTTCKVPRTGNMMSPFWFTRYPMVNVFAEAAAELVVLVDSFGALNIAEASGFELLTVMLIKSFN